MRSGAAADDWRMLTRGRKMPKLRYYVFNVMMFLGLGFFVLIQQWKGEPDWKTRLMRDSSIYQ